MMSIIQTSLKALSFTALLASTSVYATDISVGGSTVSIDDRESAGDRDANGRDSTYNIDQMNVSWSSDNTITVDIFTNFANFTHNNNTETHNNEHGYYGDNIVYGDLLIGVDNGSSFNYAFSLGDMRTSQDAFAGNSTGGLYQISGTTSSRDHHNNSNGRARYNGAVFGNTIGNELGNNTSWGVSYGKISFTFNVAGLSIFENASSLALSWAESCFNDDVNGTFAVRRNRPATVPEPASIVLMLLALAGIAYRQKNKRKYFSA
jgi:hypothetical protein